MFRTLLVVLAIYCIEFASAKLNNPFQFTEPYKVTPISYYPGLYRSARGEVFGARTCGGTGVTLEVRNDNCLSGYAALCSLVTERKIELEYVFVPSEPADEYFIRPGVTTIDGETLAVDMPMTDQKLVAGQPYKITATVKTTSELKGKIFAGRTEIFRKSDNKLLSCIEGDYYSH